MQIPYSADKAKVLFLKYFKLSLYFLQSVCFNGNLWYCFYHYEVIMSSHCLLCE